MHLGGLDVAIILLYVAGLACMGLYFARRRQSTESYFVAGRSVPSWAMGLSLLGTIVTSVTFIAYPGAAYDGNWSLLVPGFLAVAVIGLAGSTVIPFYRRTVRMSAYEYLGQRFGNFARVYASSAFALGHLAKMAFVFYLLSLTVSSISGRGMDRVILATGLITITYTLIGGFEAVIWTDVVQGLVLWAGIATALGFLLFLPPGGPSAVFQLAAEHRKFSLGDTQMDFSKPTLPVLVLYGLFWYLQKYTADQTVVQRYLAAKTDRGAFHGVAFGTLLLVPVWALFMCIGTALWSFYRLTHIALPEWVQKGDQVFPYFLSTQLPPGIAGLLLAALVGAAMCSLASDLNSFAVVGVEDIYRLVRPGADDGRRLHVAKAIVAACGLLCVSAALALALAHAKGSTLSLWYSVSAISSGGLAGLFLLAVLPPDGAARRRSRRRGEPRLHRLGLADTARKADVGPGELELPMARLYGGRGR